MHTIDETIMDAPAASCFQVAADVARWPDVLPHYRWVRLNRSENGGTARVEMAARRDFGPVPYPVWWVSEMRLDPDAPTVLYHHVDGITTGMDVVWSFEELDGDRTRVRIVHDWKGGPAWPLPRFLRNLIADVVIGPIFIRHVASRTLKGIRREVEGMNVEKRNVGR